ELLDFGGVERRLSAARQHVESGLRAGVETGHARVERRRDIVQKTLRIVQRRRAELRERHGEVVPHDQLEIGMARQEGLQLRRSRSLASLHRIVDEAKMIGGQLVTAELAQDGGEIEAGAPVRGVITYGALQMAERRLQTRFAGDRGIFVEQ